MPEILKQIEESKNQKEAEEQEQKSRQLPIGIGGTKLKEDRETLPAIKVANEVSWVNNKMNLPFNLKVGDPSPLGMFLTPNPQEGESTYNLEVSDVHTRSGILGRVIFSDKEGRLYRDIDLKGIGFNKVSNNTRIVIPTRPQLYSSLSEYSRFSSFKGTTGIANQELIRRDIDFSEKFLKAGIRTHRVIALIDLNEIVDYRGNRVSIKEAKSRDTLSKQDEPVIEVRAYGVRSRLFDVINSLRLTWIEEKEEEYKSKALKLLSDAKNIVAQELGINPSKFGWEDYFEWLIKTTVINIARMHYHGWVSGYITSHNMTLDGRIVDLDSVETLVEYQKTYIPDSGQKQKSFERDLVESAEDFNHFLREVEKLGIFYLKDRSVIDYFNSIYNKELERLKSEKKSRKSKK